MARCQICGRKTALNRKGMVPCHHVRGAVCAGAGFPPIEESDARLAALVADTCERSRRMGDVLRALRHRRANWIDPALAAQDAALWIEADKLARRLKRHRAWPARFAREMALRGYGTPPPAYLVQHESGKGAAPHE